MKIEVATSLFPEVKISTGINFQDERGSLKKTIFGDDLMKTMGNVQEVLCTTSIKNSVRGLHFQDPPFAISKFIQCVSGEILDVFLDIRNGSPTYGLHGTRKLNADDNNAIFIPEGFAHGFITLSQQSIVVYLQSGDYNAEFDQTINPLSLNIDWLSKSPIISDKDLNGVHFKDYKPTINY
jgi:dTDP-4-dehydrorhamnose 3,5-epimerase